MIIYSKIYSLWEKESTSAELSTIESDFITQIEHYMKNLKTNLKSSKNAMVSELMEQKIVNLSYIIEDLFRKRLTKVLTSILKGKSVPKDSLCLQEIDVFTSIQKVLKKYLETLTLLQKGHSIENQDIKLVNGDYITIRFLKEVPQILGSDLKQYGPFLVDDVAVLPTKNVQTLLKHSAIALINKET